MGNDEAAPAQQEPQEEKSTSKFKSIESREVDFKVHIAIDFGTDGCGIAFAYKNKITLYNQWRTVSRARKTKTKTQLILNQRNAVTCFGNVAKHMYLNWSSNEQKSMMFFERFKMALYDQGDNLNRANAADDSKRQELHTAKYLHASNGKRRKSETVFVAVFKELQTKAKKHLSATLKRDKIKDEEIQWIVTVPAIWSEKAKQQMKQWIIKAGLVDKHIIDQCIIVYEPDCASLAIQKQFFGQNNAFNPENANPTDDPEEKEDDQRTEGMLQQTKFGQGDTYILIDAGGGTVDIACHTVVSDGCVEEIVHPTGDKWGSCYIDDLYFTLLEDIFGKRWIDEFPHDDAPSCFVELMDNFQTAKKTFYKQAKNQKKKPKEATHSIDLPIDFMRYLEHQCLKINSSPEAMVKQYNKKVDIKYFRKLFANQSSHSDGKTEKCLVKLNVFDEDEDEYEDNEECLELSTNIWKCLFDSKIDLIINHVDGLLQRNELKKCEYLGLVGGFSASKYFQERMRSAFGRDSQHKLTIIIPDKPILSVVRGAAYFALEPGYIKARKLKYTYGIRVYLSVKDARKRGISEAYITNNQTEKAMVKDCFNVIARRDDHVAFNQVVLEKVHKIPGESSALITIMRSKQKNPKVATNAVGLGSIQIEFDGDHTEVMVEFHFYGAVFKVYSYPKSNPRQRKQVAINYAKNRMRKV